MAKAIFNNANCMGYAFGKNKWMIPHGWQESPDETVQFIKRHFGGDVRFHKIYSANEGSRMTQELPLGKTFVVYREDTPNVDDFHFVKRLPSGHWRHKMGSRKIKPITQKSVAKREWISGFLNYDSPYYVFELV